MFLLYLLITGKPVFDIKENIITQIAVNYYIEK